MAESTSRFYVHPPAEGEKKKTLSLIFFKTISFSLLLPLFQFHQELRKQCQDFATALLDHTRSSYELEVMLNHDPKGPAFEHGDRMSLNRLKLAIKYRQKKARASCFSCCCIHRSNWILIGCSSFSFCAVRGSSERTATIGFHLVRRSTGLPAEEYGNP